MKRGGKKRARSQAAKRQSKATKKKKLPLKAAARPAKRRTKVPPAKKRAVAVKQAKPAVDFERELKRERATRHRLEKRLTALVQELGQIRIYEVRCGMLEEELRRRDEELSAFRRAAVANAGQTELPLGAP